MGKLLRLEKEYTHTKCHWCKKDRVVVPKLELTKFEVKQQTYGFRAVPFHAPPPSKNPNRGPECHSDLQLDLLLRLLTVYGAPKTTIAAEILSRNATQHSRDVPRTPRTQ